MTRTHRESTLGIASSLWFVAMLIAWFGPDDGLIDVLGLAAACAGLAAFLVWLGGWIRARWQDDPTAQIDPRVVLGGGMLAALGAAALVEWLTDSGPAGLAVFVVLIVATLVGYVRPAPGPASVVVAQSLVTVCLALVVISVAAAGASVVHARGTVALMWLAIAALGALGAWALRGVADR